MRFFLFSGTGPGCFEKTLEPVQDPVWAQLQPLGCHAHCFLHRLFHQRCARLQLQPRLHQWTFEWEGLPWHGERCFKDRKAVRVTAQARPMPAALHAIAPGLHIWFCDFTARRFYSTGCFSPEWCNLNQGIFHMYVYICIYTYVGVSVYLYSMNSCTYISIYVCAFIYRYKLCLFSFYCVDKVGNFCTKGINEGFLIFLEFCIRLCCVEAISL